MIKKPRGSPAVISTGARPICAADMSGHKRRAALRGRVGVEIVVALLADIDPDALLDRLLQPTNGED